MNESEDGSGKEVFKAWEQRLDRNKVSSDVIKFIIVARDVTSL